VKAQGCLWLALLLKQQLRAALQPWLKEAVLGHPSHKVNTTCA
jgi:hypothetical protein